MSAACVLNRGLAEGRGADDLREVPVELGDPNFLARKLDSGR